MAITSQCFIGNYHHERLGSRRMRCLLHLQADAAHDGEAGKQPFLIWEDRGKGDPSLAKDLPSEDEEPAEALPEVITASHSSQDCCMRSAPFTVVTGKHAVRPCTLVLLVLLLV